MGLTYKSTGKAGTKKARHQEEKYDISVALAGNPNVGKSTVFNALTGMHQHTGNWTGKTVGGATGTFKFKNKNILLTDIPGCYSLNAHSLEEEVARDILCYSGIEKVVVVCDATCLKRNLTLVLQVAEMVGSCIVCINLEDEARLRNITINLEQLSKKLSMPVVSTTARSGKGLNRLCEAIISPQPQNEIKIEYPTYIEQTIIKLCNIIEPRANNSILKPRFIAIKLLENNKAAIKTIENLLGKEFFTKELTEALEEFRRYLEINGISEQNLTDTIANCVYKKADSIAQAVIKKGVNKKDKKDLKIDKLLTGKFTAFPIMFLMLLAIFYITISGANIPSSALSNLLFSLEKTLYDFSLKIGVPLIISEVLFHGVFRTVAWIIAVMLPPMAIFFPLFTLLEDAGILPRIAFNLDRAFAKCNTCGKQALTMCMGFGCNAAGVVGCRIIDSPRERLIAILTNSLVPCNGRFPGIISMIAMFLIFGSAALSSVTSAAILSGFIIASIAVTLVVSKLLSKTLLKGIPSSFTLELPPYRRPQVLRVIIRSIFDRTLFVLSRALVVAAPAGLLIWLAANIHISGASLLFHITTFLEPLGRLLGLDGVIITAFLLGFPANEIVIPIMLMGYTAGANLVEFGSISVIKNILLDNNWTILTALNFIIFSLFHFPCSTTILTIKKETNSVFWTMLSFIIPTIIGAALCMLTNFIFNVIF